MSDRFKQGDMIVWKHEPARVQEHIMFVVSIYEHHENMYVIMMPSGKIEVCHQNNYMLIA